MDDGQERDSRVGSSNPVDEAAQRDMRPGFLGGEGGGEKPNGLGDERSKDAEEKLREAEKSAESNKQDDKENKDDNLNEARDNEEEPRGYYTGNGRGEEKKKKKRGIKAILGKKGPVIAIVLSIFGVGGLIAGAQLMQPFGLLANLQETFGKSMETSVKKRSEAFFRYQMDTGRTKSPFNIFGSDFKISDKQKAKLKKQGIEYVEEDGVRKLRYTGDDGKIHDVTAANFKEEYMKSPDFFSKYNAGSMTWRGAIANWFGTVTSKFMVGNKITRNLFKDFQDKVAGSGGKSSKAVAIDMMSQRAKNITDGGVRIREADEKEMVEVKDENGETKKVPEWFLFKSEGQSPMDNSNEKPRTDYKDSSLASEPSGTIDRSKMDEQAVRAKLNDISGKVQKGANMACAVMNTIGAVSLLVTASEALQIINLTTAYFEAIDKVKAGDGTDTPINDLMNAMNEKKRNEHVTLVSSGAKWNASSDRSNFAKDDDLKTLTTEKTSTEKTAMESSGIASFFGGRPVDPKDPSVQSFNFTGSIKRILGGLGASMTAFETCAIAKITANTTTALVDAVEVAGCILGAVGAAFTFGVSLGGCGPLVAKTLAGIALGVAIGVAVAGVISTITPVIAQMMTRDLITDLGGEDLGNALTSGANMYLGNTHRANGGSLSTTEKYIEFAMAQKEVIAEDAKYERMTKSPFDITSKYTFMGTLLTQAMSFLSANSLMNVVTSTSSVVSSSILALDPSASAYEIVETLPDKKEYEETCPYLASIGAVGDAFCNPYAITDVSTIEYDPATDVIEKLAEEGNFLSDATSDGNVKINGKSDLAKYILFCDNRTSAFGIADQNIVNEVSSWGSVQTGSSAFNTVVNSAIGAIPVFGDFVDIVSNQQALDNIGYISGESCVAGNTVNANSSPDWNKAKYYQRFIEDQSLAESMGVIGESAVAVFLNDYYKENPLDNSYEGMLARYSGLDKETVVAVLDLIEYGNYIANYHPEERYWFGEPKMEMEEERLMFDDGNDLAVTHVILLNQISYADVRNRTWTV